MENNHSIDNIDCILLNARSIALKWKQLCIELFSSKIPNIIFLTETWLSSDYCYDYISLPGYTLFRSDRSNKKGGGVMCLASNTLKPMETKVGNMHCSTDHFNILCIDAYATKRISLILIYLRPTATENDIKEMFTTVGHLIDGAKGPVIMFG